MSKTATTGPEATLRRENEPSHVDALGGGRLRRFQPGALRRLGVLLLLLLCCQPLPAAEKNFTVSGVTLSLEEVSSAVGVTYQSMRFNRAAHIWNVEVVLTNQSTRAFNGPFVLSVESYSGTTGPLQADGLDGSAPPKAFYELSGVVTNGVFSPGDRSASRTLSFGFTNGPPRLVTKVYMKPALPGGPLGLTRSLNEVGQPLPNVMVMETGPQGPRTNFTDATFGVVTLGQGQGEHVWKFSAPDYLPVWLTQTLDTNGVAVLPNPRLVRRGTKSFSLTPLDGGLITNRDGSIQINFASGSFAQNSTATLTPVTAQTLPAFLPLAWIPLQAFWLELSAEPAQTASATLTPWGTITSSETAALVHLDTTNLHWTVLRT